MRRAKGAFFKKIAIIIRADKSGVYDNLLTDEDKQVISTTILTANWYPWDTYKRCFNAVAAVTANNDMEICRLWGQLDSGEELAKSSYKSILLDRNVKVAFRKIRIFWKIQYSFGDLDVNFISDNKVQVTIQNFDPDFEVFYYYGRGWYEQVLIMCDCKDVKSEFLVKSWEGAGDTVIQLSWTS
jgi:hypothetical protein